MQKTPIFNHKRFAHPPILIWHWLKVCWIKETCDEVHKWIQQLKFAEPNVCLYHTSNTHTIPAKIWNIWKAQWKHSYLTFLFARIGLAPTTNGTLTCCVMVVKCNLQCSKLEIHNRMYNLLLCLKYPTISWLSILTLWRYDNFVCIQ